MDRQPRLDLAYTHDTAASARQVPCGRTAQKPKDLDLTARLRCLKALYDLERDEPASRENAH